MLSNFKRPFLHKFIWLSGKNRLCEKNLKIISDIDLHVVNENTNLMNNQSIFPGE